MTMSQKKVILGLLLVASFDGVLSASLAGGVARGGRRLKGSTHYEGSKSGKGSYDHHFLPSLHPYYPPEMDEHAPETLHFSGKGYFVSSSKRTKGLKVKGSKGIKGGSKSGSTEGKRVFLDCVDGLQWSVRGGFFDPCTKTRPKPKPKMMRNTIQPTSSLAPSSLSATEPPTVEGATEAPSVTVSPTTAGQSSGPVASALPTVGQSSTPSTPSAPTISPAPSLNVASVVPTEEPSSSPSAVATESPGPTNTNAPTTTTGAPSTSPSALEVSDAPAVSSSPSQSAAPAGDAPSSPPSQSEAPANSATSAAPTTSQEPTGAPASGSQAPSTFSRSPSQSPQPTSEGISASPSVSPSRNPSGSANPTTSLEPTGPPAAPSVGSQSPSSSPVGTGPSEQPSQLPTSAIESPLPTISSQPSSTQRPTSSPTISNEPSVSARPSILPTLSVVPTVTQTSPAAGPSVALPTPTQVPGPTQSPNPTTVPVPTLSPGPTGGEPLPTLSPGPTVSDAPTVSEAPSILGLPTAFAASSVTVEATAFSLAYTFGSSATASLEQTDEAIAATQEYIDTILMATFDQTPSTPAESVLSTVIARTDLVGSSNVGFEVNVTFPGGLSEYPDQADIDVLLETGFALPAVQDLLDSLALFLPESPYSTTSNVTYTALSSVESLLGNQDEGVSIMTSVAAVLGVLGLLTVIYSGVDKHQKQRRGRIRRDFATNATQAKHQLDLISEWARGDDSQTGRSSSDDSEPGDPMAQYWAGARVNSFRSASSVRSSDASVLLSTILDSPGQVRRWAEEAPEELPTWLCTVVRSTDADDLPYLPADR